MRFILFSVCTLAFLAPTFSLPPIFPPAAQCEAVERADLKQRLEKGLKARLPSEFAFVDLVVKRVHEGKLPLKLVDGVFLWARRQPRHQFQYFEFAMRKQAAKIGVPL